MKKEIEKDLEKDNLKAVLKAVKTYCLDSCCCGYRKEVDECEIKICELWNFRDGKNPFRKKREISEERKEEMIKNLKKAREMRDA